MDIQDELTGAKAGISGEFQIRIALQAMADRDGKATMSEIYNSVEYKMDGKRLSEQGKASLRRLINKDARLAGYVTQDERGTWQITQEGKEYISSDVKEDVIDVVTEKLITVSSNTSRGMAFELYILDLHKVMFPLHVWHHQGQQKSNERGLDLIGKQIVPTDKDLDVIGIQVKFHTQNSAPTQLEWWKFLAGCFARKVNRTVFVTTGKLTSEQRREAGESEVVVIEGRDEVIRIAKQWGIKPFELFEDKDSSQLITDSSEDTAHL